ncbi:MAG: hypothetical protein SFX73_37655 [Kofleriaceae bacterium]|nr:hypothetical protein [Kofleriaceae bacterium]
MIALFAGASTFASAAPNDTKPVAAWQTFANRPSATVAAGRTRASWPADRPEPAWVANTHANLALSSFDGKVLTGEVEMWAGLGVDPAQCNVEIIWDAQRKRGARLTAPPAATFHPGVGTNAIWRFTVPVSPALPMLEATAFVFCPGDVMFTSIHMVRPGPRAKATYCKALRAEPTPTPIVTPRLERHETYQLLFACGAMIRLRGRELIDECRGDVLGSLDALGTSVTIDAPLEGTALTDTELYSWFAGNTHCSDLTLRSQGAFSPQANAPFAALLKRAGKRLLEGFSRDGMPHPPRPR